VTWTTIVADPPWPYRNARSFGNSKAHRPHSYQSPMNGPGAALRYPLMPLAAIKALTIPAADNAHLYLWTTNAFIAEAHDVARAWGFAPKTILTWVKVQHEDPTQVSRKMGYYFRGATEHIVFAVRGRLRLRELNLPTAYLWPRVARHSQKPEHFYDLVERASPGPYLELFARRRRLGWDAWGNEVASSVEVAS
jgi:N6-adenosine-specific RNA methylase IME4